MNHDIDAEIQRAAPRMNDLIALSLLFILFFGIVLGSHTLGVPDEARYSEIPREMVETGDYLTPRLNGVKYFEKPPLFYWLQTLSIRIFGLNAWSLHLWTALFALLGCLFVFVAGRSLYGRRAGLLAAGALATSLLYYAMSRAITLDMTVSVLLSGALLSFLLGVRETEERRRRWYLWSFYILAALATLTKGLIGIVIPVMIIGSWIAILNEWRILRRIHLVSGTLLFLLIAAPWHVLVARANPEFLQFYFIHEHFQRYLTKIHGRYEPFWYFIPVFAGGFFPWVAFLAQSVVHSLPRAWQERHQHREALFLMLWAGLVFLFFSASDSKLLPYILPIFPPMAILVGRYLADAWDHPGQRGVRAGYWMLLAVGSVLAAALILAPRYRDASVPLHTVRLHLDLLAVIIVLTGLAVYLLGRRRSLFQAVHMLMAGSALFLMIANPVFTELDTRPVKDLAMDLKQRLRPGDEVMSYFNYYQDLPVYLERRITVVDWKGELAFGATAEDTTDWMIEEQEFQKRWRDPSRTMYLLTDLKIYERLRQEKDLPLHPLAQNRRTILVCNREVKL